MSSDHCCNEPPETPQQRRARLRAERQLEHLAKSQQAPRESILKDPHATMNRRRLLFLAGGIVLASAGVLAFRRKAPAVVGKGRAVTMYASADCECCHLWKRHMEKAGFDVQTDYPSNLPQRKQELGVPESLQSCHTAIVDGYVIEGHVPSDIVARFLAERPTAHGLTAPGMPAGSPGMENLPKAPYDVLVFDRDGSSRVYATV